MQTIDALQVHLDRIHVFFSSGNCRSYPEESIYNANICGQFSIDSCLFLKRSTVEEENLQQGYE